MVAPSASDRSSVAIVIPIYKPQFEALEQFSVDFSLSQVVARDCYFLAPEGMDCSYYANRYPQVTYKFFAKDYFESIDSYSRLMLSRDFYARFAAYQFILILQPDAILFRDDLDFWANQGYDYVGAPWPEGMELTVWRDNFSGDNRRRVKAHVGNGGLSLRRVGKSVKLIEEFPESHEAFLRATANEDAFFSIMGLVSGDFSIPDVVVASRFAMELQPEYFMSINGGQYPMGAHAWWIVNPKFWAPCIPRLASILAETGG